MVCYFVAVSTFVMQKSDHPSNMNMKKSIVLCVFVNSMIHGGTDNLVNNLPLSVPSQTFGSDTQAIFHWGH
jgi:hypothetical protein